MRLETHLPPLLLELLRLLLLLTSSSTANHILERREQQRERERERERDRDKDREREFERLEREQRERYTRGRGKGGGRGLGGANQSEVMRLRDALRDSEYCLRDANVRHENEIDTEGEIIRKLEESLADEREDRCKVSREQADVYGRFRDTAMAAENKLREAVHKAKADAEDDWRNILKSTERRAGDDMD